MRLLLAGVLFAVLAGSAAGPAADAPIAPEAAAHADYGPYGLDLSGRDPEVRPGDDFFRHVNGRWLARTAIPPDHSSIGVAEDLRDEVERRLRAILERGADGLEGPL